MSLNFPPVIGFETSKCNAAETFYPTAICLVQGPIQSWVGGRVVGAIPAEYGAHMQQALQNSPIFPEKEIQEYGNIPSRYSKFFTIAGYLPFIGIVIGFIRLVAGAAILYVAHTFENLNTDYTPSLKAFGIKMIARGALEFLGFGFVLLIPDLLFTFYREFRPTAFEDPNKKLWSPREVFQKKAEPMNHKNHQNQHGNDVPWESGEPHPFPYAYIPENF